MMPFREGLLISKKHLWTIERGHRERGPTFSRVEEPIHFLII